MIQNILSQMVSHFGSRIQLKVLCLKFFMLGKAACLLVPVKCIFKLLPSHIFPSYLKAAWLATLVTFLNVVSEFLYVVLHEHETNFYIRKSNFRLLPSLLLFLLFNTRTNQLKFPYLFFILC